MSVVQTLFHQCTVVSGDLTHPPSLLSSAKHSVNFTVCSVASPVTVVNENDCQLSVRHLNPRQYVADIPQLATNLEVWFQHPKDIVRRPVSGDLDLRIVGLDTVSEYGQGNEDLILVHDALAYGDCRLSLAIPKYGIFENINSVKELAQMSLWTAEKPLRVVTGFTYMGPKFLKENGIKHVTFSTADGALEAAPVVSLTLLKSEFCQEVHVIVMFSSNYLHSAGLDALRAESLSEADPSLHQSILFASSALCSFRLHNLVSWCSTVGNFG
ncbi:hypothetical protein OSB04_006622 [Centaurea solstitialis]|uniref:ATP phosphoribosyltransferase n=1 Tax=Centaurea solstitialis TaxID=347529 RepID=A0AA38U1H8_9ASTR|nr:hypothetical protein OSB04_006622 [Centaurea solstitialis]